MAGEGKRGRRPGAPKTGGRKKGTPNRSTVAIAEQVDALDCDTVGGLVRIAKEEIPCKLCRGAKRFKYRQVEVGPGLSKLVLDPENGTLMSCRNCLGSGLEPIPVALQLKAYSTLLEYLHPKRKAIEVKAPDGKGDVELADLLVVLRRAQRG